MSSTTNQFSKEDLVAMIRSDKMHLVRHMENGDRIIAHDLLDVIIDNQRHLEDLTRTA